MAILANFALALALASVTTDSLSGNNLGEYYFSCLSRQVLPLAQPDIKDLTANDWKSLLQYYHTHKRYALFEFQLEDIDNYEKMKKLAVSAYGNDFCIIKTFYLEGLCRLERFEILDRLVVEITGNYRIAHSFLRDGARICLAQRFPTVDFAVSLSDTFDCPCVKDEDIQLPDPSPLFDIQKMLNTQRYLKLAFATNRIGIFKQILDANIDIWYPTDRRDYADNVVSVLTELNHSLCSRPNTQPSAEQVEMLKSFLSKLKPQHLPEIVNKLPASCSPACSKIYLEFFSGGRRFDLDELLKTLVSAVSSKVIKECVETLIMFVVVALLSFLVRKLN